MKHPFKSFSFGLIIYLLLILAFGFIVYKVVKAPEANVVVEAEMINQEANHEEPKAEEEILQEKSIVENKKFKKAKKPKVEPKAEEYSKEEKQAIEIAKRAEPIYQPLPAIPNELRYEALNTTAKGRFYVDAKGNVLKVELINPCNEPKLNFLLLKQLKKWKFEAGTISFVQDINVTFKVE
jgi:outer membrane biosynthesis protein TonB